MGLAFTIKEKLAIKTPAKPSSDSNRSRSGFRTFQDGQRTPKSTQNASDRYTNSTQSETPSVCECKVHLKLLKALAYLRGDVTSSPSRYLRQTQQESEENIIAQDVAEQCWNTYCQRAAQRFEKWWGSVMPHTEHSSDMQATCSICLTAGGLESLLETTKPMAWSAENMPPLDVLMVLHSYMLNPRCFLEDCIRLGMLPLWKSGFPWALVDACIQPGSYEYTTSDAAHGHWEKKTGYQWENTEKSFPKPASDTTTAGMSKIGKSIQELKTNGVPLPGTVLTYFGEAVSRPVGIECEDHFLLNYLMCTDLGERLVAGLPEKSVETEIVEWVEEHQNQHITVEQPIFSTHTTRVVVPAKPAPRTRASIQRFVSATSEESVFSLDLAAAVIRQCVFVDAMQDVAWNYSPALDLTVTQLLNKYSIFMRIIGRYPDKVATPTHAVDLAWHTHQLSPSSYYKYSLATTKAERPNGHEEFIDHDDKLSETVLTGAFEWTGQAYQLLTGEDSYSECFCWDCMTRMLVKQTTRNTLISKRRENVVSERIASMQYQKLEDDFAREMKRAKANDLPCMDQNSFLQRYVWLYPNAIPILESSAMLEPKSENEQSANAYTETVDKERSLPKWWKF